MAEIRPFRGIHYSKVLADELSAVICPPHDIISPRLQQELYLKSDYNFVRLEFGQELPDDSATESRYTRAAAMLEQWLKQGVLEMDEKPVLYLYDQYFVYQGKQHRRRGLTCRVRLEEWARMVVRPHEDTIPRSRHDRLDLLWALQANTSPILSLFEDKGRRVASLLAAQENNPPLLDGQSDGERHVVRAIAEPEIIREISRCFARQPLYIADGHHRYESALIHQHERLACSPSVSGKEAFNFVMMTLVDFADPGLLILPPHRLVRGISPADWDGLMAKLMVFFAVERLPLNKSGIWQQVDNLLADKSEIRLVLFGLDAEHLFVLRVHAPEAISQVMPCFHSELYKQLDVSIADDIILKKLLPSGGGGKKLTISYCHERRDAVEQVLKQEYQMALLLSPPLTGTLRTIADAGDRMPCKSTYFHPKLPAGLILNRLV